MQTAHQEVDGSQTHQVTVAQPDLVADAVAAYAAEVRLLRQRVALLEAELAASKASRNGEPARLRKSPPLTSIDFAPQTLPAQGNAVGEFSEGPSRPASAVGEFSEGPSRPASAVGEFSEGQSGPGNALGEFSECQPAPSVSSSEFIETRTPAVASSSATSEATPTIAAPRPSKATDGAEADPGFADAWMAEDAAASFEERIAERAFFQAATVDEESRNWLLAH